MTSPFSATGAGVALGIGTRVIRVTLARSLSAFRFILRSPCCLNDLPTRATPQPASAGGRVQGKRSLFPRWRNSGSATLLHFLRAACKSSSTSASACQRSCSFFAPAFDPPRSSPFWIFFSNDPTHAVGYGCFTFGYFFARVFAAPCFRGATLPRRLLLPEQPAPCGFVPRPLIHFRFITSGEMS